MYEYVHTLVYPGTKDIHHFQHKQEVNVSDTPGLLALVGAGPLRFYAYVECVCIQKCI